MRRVVLASCVVLLCALPARAHKLKTSERAILQVREDATEILYELAIPAGAQAARWRVVYDVNRDGRLSKSEYEALVKGLGAAVRDHLALRLEGTAMPLQVKDAKVTSTEGGDAFSGRLAALVWLTAREIPAGKRTLELEAVPLVEPTNPVLFRLEVANGTIESVSGTVRGKSQDGVDTVKLRKGMRCRLLLDIPPKTPAR
jgi:hypothetical protein